MRAIIMAVLISLFVAATVSLAEEGPPLNEEVSTGITLVNNGDFRKAVEVLREALNKAPDDLEANFYLGVALNRLSEKEAESVLKRSLMEKPDNPHVNFELGLFYFNKNIDAEAGDYFENVLTLAPDGEYAAQAREYLKRIEGKGREKKWALNFLSGLQYDSNVIVSGGTLPAGISHKSDWNGLISLRGRYSLFNNSDMELTGGYSLYQTLHTKLDDYDVTQNLFDLSFLYGALPDIKLKLAYSFEYMLLGGNQYDYAHIIAPSLIRDFGEWGSTTLDYRFRTISYSNFGAFGANTDRDGDNHYVGITHVLPLSKSYSVWGSYSHDEELTRQTFWNYHGDRVAAGFRASLPYNAMADISGEYYHKGYEAVNPALPGAIRDDDQFSLSFTVMKMLSQTFSLIAMEQYTRNQSNIGTYDYVRAVTSLFLNARF